MSQEKSDIVLSSDNFRVGLKVQYDGMNGTICESTWHWYYFNILWDDGQVSEFRKEDLPLQTVYVIDEFI